MTSEQFIRKLQKARIAHTLSHFDSVEYVEVGPYGFRFENAQSRGGWIRDCGDDWRSEARAWMKLLG